MTTSLGLKILCVEDDAPILDILGQALEGEGYEVALTSTAEEAWARLQKGGFDLVITDYQLPGMDGVTLLQRALAQDVSRGTKGLLLSAHPHVPNPSALPFLRKPLDLDGFLHCVHELLTEAREEAMSDAKERKGGGDSDRTRRLIELVLYVSGASPSSLKAVRRIHGLLASKRGEVQLRIVDLAKEFPPEALEDRVAFTPTVVRRWPGPKVWILGSLDDDSAFLNLLQDSIEIRTR